MFSVYFWGLGYVTGSCGMQGLLMLSWHSVSERQMLQESRPVDGLVFTLKEKIDVFVKRLWACGVSWPITVEQQVKVCSVMLFTFTSHTFCSMWLFLFFFVFFLLMFDPLTQAGQIPNCPSRWLDNMFEERRENVRKLSELDDRLKHLLWKYLSVLLSSFQVKEWTQTMTKLTRYCFVNTVFNQFTIKLQYVTTQPFRVHLMVKQCVWHFDLE